MIFAQHGMSPYHIVYSIFSKIMVRERIKKINMALKLFTNFPSISALLWYFPGKMCMTLQCGSSFFFNINGSVHRSMIQ
jgi:hypothetical protein